MLFVKCKFARKSTCGYTYKFIFAWKVTCKF